MAYPCPSRPWKHRAEGCRRLKLPWLDPARSRSAARAGKNAVRPNAWPNVIPFFQFPPEIRKITYTTNAIESLNASMRKYTRNRKIFPNDESALKSMFLAIREVSSRWRSVHHWKPALQLFQILFGEERVPLNS